MSFAGTLVDRARTVEPERLAQRVEGSTRWAEVHGPWRPARLTLASTPETVGTDPGSARVVEHPQLLLGRGEAIPSSARVEVESARQLAERESYEVTATQMVYKRRSLVAQTCELRRVES